MDINKRLDELVGLNMLKHTREHEMAIGNHLIAVREYVEKQDTVIVDAKMLAESVIVKNPAWGIVAHKAKTFLRKLEAME